MSRFGLVFIVGLLTTLPSFACSVPVFRYALERWQPARYDLFVYHRGALTPADRTAVGRFEAAALRANARVIDADLDARIDENVRAIWDQEGQPAALPRLVLRYPESSPKVASVWSGPLSTDPNLLFDSAGRRELFDRLTAGYAGAVILLLSGDGPADDAARKLLRSQLPHIASQIKLPAPTDDGPQVISELPLRIEFPVVEVARTPSEELFVRMLIGSEAGLSAVNGPIAFPVFGRGRALCSLHDKELRDPTELQRSMEFLCRECSCQVKELNPGVDLLITANWDIVFEAERGPQPRTLAVAAETRAAGPWNNVGELRSAPPAGYHAAEIETGAPNRQPRSWLLRIGTAAAAFLVLLTGYWALRGRRAASPSS
jgi:hypothetical protein